MIITFESPSTATDRDTADSSEYARCINPEHGDVKVITTRIRREQEVGPESKAQDGLNLGDIRGHTPEYCFCRTAARYKSLSGVLVLHHSRANVVATHEWDAVLKVCCIRCWLHLSCLAGF